MTYSKNIPRLGPLLVRVKGKCIPYQHGSLSESGGILSVVELPQTALPIPLAEEPQPFLTYF